MREMQTITVALKRTSSRRRWQRAWRGLWKGMFVGAAIWFATLVVFKLAPIPFASLGVAAIVWGGCALVGFASGLIQRESLIETARWVDERQSLKERLTAALEFGDKGAEGEWSRLIMSDAVSHADTVNPKRLLPYHLPPLARWTALILVACVGLGFVPEYRSEKYLQTKREEANIKDTGRHLAEFVRRNLERKPPAMEPTQKAMDSVEELGHRLTKAKLTRGEALQDIAKMSNKLKEDAQALTSNAALKKLKQAARTPTGANTSTTSAALQKRIQDLKDQLGENAGSPEALEDLKNDLEQLKQAAAGMEGAEGAKAAELKKQVAEALADLAMKASDLGASLPELEAAMSELAANNFDRFLKELDMAEIDLGKMLEMAKELQQLQLQFAKMGEDLAEQLELGQASQARANLLDKIEKLKNSQLSKEDLQSMLDEIGDALDPAGEYGKVADFLKEAMQQMQAGDRQAGAQAMQAAADELQKLIDQFGDAEAMMATLKALSKAGMCIGNCQAWGQNGPPKFGPGGKPGSGVGTWADEDSGWVYYPPQSDGWDNSGIERPDMEGKGNTDRGDGELSENLRPDKVRGKFSPGEAMPSITLRGVSIKGESNVRVEQVMTSAQGEAESALSQEKVPRAYQSAVRDYFDDLKE